MRGLCVVAALAGVLCMTGAAEATHVSCGQTLTADTVLDTDLTCTTEAALVVGADGVTIDLNGREIRAGASERTVEWGVLAGTQAGTTIRNGIIRGFRYGLQSAGDEPVVEEVTFVENVVAVNFFNAGRGLVAGNRFDRNRNGVYVVNRDSNRGRNVVRANLFSGAENGVSVELTSDNLIEDNVMSGMVNGVNLYGASAGTRVVGNQIELAPEGGGTGVVLFTEGVDNEVIDNTIQGGRLGIRHAHSATGNRIAGNSITGSRIGIQWDSTAPDMRIENNLVDRATHTGIFVERYIGTPRPTDRTFITGNRVTNSQGDGILVTENPAQVVLEGNIVSGSVDDGIEAAPNWVFGAPPSQHATMIANSAWGNGDWGMIAESPASDGGGNRAWSNGQPFQCLRVVCGPGPPATLALSPGTATNAVGDEHCVTASVTDPDGRGTPGETVRFSVNGDGSASRLTDAGGSATFCYDGPLASGTDEIAAFADSDTDGTHDVDEPGGNATKNWVVPPSDDCRAKGKGRITAANGDEATFDLNIHATGNGGPGGRHSYRDLGPAQRVIARSRTIEAVTCASGTASVFGTAWVTGTTAPVRFRLDLAESPDTYRIRLGTGYDSGAATVSSGNIRIQ